MGHLFHFSCPRTAFTFLLVLAVSLLLASTGNAAGDAQALPEIHGGSLIHARWPPPECFTRCGLRRLCCSEGDVCISGNCCPYEQKCGTVCCPTGSSCHNNKCCPSNKFCGANCCQTGGGIFSIGETYCINQTLGLCCEVSTDFVCGGKCCRKGMRCIQGQCLQPIKAPEQCKIEHPSDGRVCQSGTDCPVASNCVGGCSLGCCFAQCN